MGNTNQRTVEESGSSVSIYSNTNPLYYQRELIQLLSHFLNQKGRGKLSFKPLMSSILNNNSIIFSGLLSNISFFISSQNNHYSLFLFQQFVFDEKFITFEKEEKPILPPPPKEEEKIEPPQETFSISVIPPSIEEKIEYNYTCSLGIVCFYTPQVISKQSIPTKKISEKSFHNKKKSAIKKDKRNSVAGKTFEEIYNTLLIKQQMRNPDF